MEKNILIAVCLVFLATPCLAASLEETRKAAEQGDAVAQSYLGIMYVDGRGVPHDEIEAVKWFRKAAEQGFAVAQFNLGIMYADGRGVPRNEAEAVKWLRKAAEQGLALAQYNLGVMYADGRGVPRDYISAYLWYALAAAQGHKQARTALEDMEKIITPEQRAEAQKLAREWKPKKP